jgi:hypothetical protein
VTRPPQLSDDSVPSVRVLYPDLHGVARGKDLPTGEFERTIEPRRSPSHLSAGCMQRSIWLCMKSH